MCVATVLPGEGTAGWWWWLTIVPQEGAHVLTIEPVGVFLMIAKCHVVVADSGQSTPTSVNKQLCV